MKNTKQLAFLTAIVFTLVVCVFGVAKANYSFFDRVAELVADRVTGTIMSEVEPMDMGASGDTNLTNLVLSGDLTVGDALAVTGSTDFGAGVVFDIEEIIATTTLTSASGNYVAFPTSASQITVTLPATSTVGLHYTFVVTGALTGASVTIASAEGDNINGILMVNDADVVCSGEDQLNIVTDGEVIGDRVELLSTADGWVILDSDIDAAGKMTCTDPS